MGVMCVFISLTAIGVQWMLPREGWDFAFGFSSLRKVAKRSASAGISSPVVSGMSFRSGGAACVWWNRTVGFTSRRSASLKSLSPSRVEQETRIGSMPVSVMKRGRFACAASVSILLATTRLGRAASSVEYSSISRFSTS